MIWLLGGTQDARELAVCLQACRLPVTVSVVSQYGKELAAAQELAVQAGGLDRQGMLATFAREKIKLVIDASHPYAVQVSQYAMAACREAGIVYLRFERAATVLPDYDRLYVTVDYAAAAACAARLGETVFLTTGSRRLADFTAAPSLQGHRLVARVLPDAGVIAQCMALGLKPADIVAMQGPFSQELNAALFKEYRADVIVSKNSGVVGGSDSKFAAAMELGLALVVIDKPPLSYPAVAHTQQAVLNYVKEVYPCNT